MNHEKNHSIVFENKETDRINEHLSLSVLLSLQDLHKSKVFKINGLPVNFSESTTEEIERELEYLDNVIDSDQFLKEFKHYPIGKAEEEFNDRRNKFYEVITINWSFANNNKDQVDYDSSKPSPNRNEVHKNKYIFNTGQLVDFTNGMYEFAEDIISITPVENNQ